MESEIAETSLLYFWEFNDYYYSGKAINPDIILKVGKKKSTSCIKYLLRLLLENSSGQANLISCFSSVFASTADTPLQLSLLLSNWRLAHFNTNNCHVR